MTAPIAAGGLGFDTAVAGAIYGLYTSSVYMACLPGGWIADRLIGARRAVLYGGILIAAGHFSMAVPALAMFYLGLTLIVLGTGLLKGNVAVIVGHLYTKDDQRRDAGFSIFYMRYNERVQEYNTSRRQFPANLTAKVFGFKEYPFFQAPPDVKTVPKVNFSKPTGA